MPLRRGQGFSVRLKRFFRLLSILKKFVVRHDAAHNCPSNLLQVIAGQHKYFRGVQIFPGFVPKNLRQPLRSGYKIGLPPPITHYPDRRVQRVDHPRKPRVRWGQQSGPPYRRRSSPYGSSPGRDQKGEKRQPAPRTEARPEVSSSRQAAGPLRRAWVRQTEVLSRNLHPAVNSIVLTTPARQRRLRTARA